MRRSNRGHVACITEPQRKSFLIGVGHHHLSGNMRRRPKSAVWMAIPNAAESARDPLPRWLEASRGRFLGQ